MPKLTVTIEIDLGNKGFRSDPDRWHSFFEENRSRSCDSLKACVMKKNQRRSKDAGTTRDY